MTKIIVAFAPVLSFSIGAEVGAKKHHHTYMPMRTATATIPTVITIPSTIIQASIIGVAWDIWSGTGATLFSKIIGL